MNKIKVHGALFTVALIYGANYTIAKDVMGTLPPLAVIIWRIGGAGLLFWLLHSITIKEKIQSKQDYIRLFFCAVFGVATNQIMFLKGLALTTEINASVIMTSSPILVLIASSIILKEKITGLKALGILMGGFGAFMMIGGRNFEFATTTAQGDIFILVNASSYALYLVLVKPLMSRYKALTITKWIFFFGFIIAAPLCFEQFQSVAWEEVPWKIYLGLAFVVLGTTFAAYLLNAWSLGFVNPSVVGSYIYLQPILATVFALAWGRENTLTWEKVGFGTLIFIGVYLVSKKSSRTV